MGLAHGAEYDDRLLGDWWGLRTRLASYGLDLELSYTGEFAANVSGGASHEEAYADQIYLGGSLDLQRLSSFPAPKIVFSFTDRNGESLSLKAQLDTLLEVQEIYGEGNYARLNQLYLQQPNFERRAYDPWIAYGQSKTANSLFAVALDSIGQHQGVRALAVHPGGIVTDLIRHMSKAEIDASKFLDKSGKPIIDPQNNQKTPQQGAATSVWCATSTLLEDLGGVYCADCEIARLLPSDDSTEMHGVRPRAIDPVAAGRLWSLSERLTGATLD
jgi:NAD(P)-dependent dehydrogenase (short-subunit alcohol dehydrogenase family)